MDGIKFYLDNDSWVLVRFSGTEPVLRIFAEAETLEAARELIDSTKSLVNLI
jgi:phosphomannomutase